MNFRVLSFLGREEAGYLGRLEWGLCCWSQKKGGELETTLFRSEACGDSSVEDVYYVSGGVVDGYGVSIVCPDREGCVADCDRCDVVAEVGSDVDSSLAPVGCNG